ncbi:unnamed protein product [Meloidogyne enterolobii]|uniref:Uncharacterized protein n=1 Tax=Meloidogyne enterolobii TaxID=390850 RepID=A0ACB1ATU8_MELEN
MGSLISLELINVELQFISEPDNYNWLNWNLLAFVLPIFAIILILIICLIKQHHPKRNTQRWTPPPTFLVILLFILIALVSDTNSFPGRKSPLRKKPPLFKRLGKPIAKGTIPILATSAVYLGFESFAQFLTEHPDLSVAVLSVFGCLSVLVLLLIVKVAIFLFHLFKGKNARPQPPIELQDLNSNIQELVNRSNPRH